MRQKDRFLDDRTGYYVPGWLLRYPYAGARPARAGEENRRKKYGGFPKVPTKILRGVVFGGLYGFILLLLDRIQNNPIG